MNKKKLEIIGTDLYNKFVWSGTYQFVGSYGFPLELLLLYFHKNNGIIDWIDFILDALREGANPSTIKSKIISASTEIYWGKELEEFSNEIENLFSMIEEIRKNEPQWPE